MNLNLWLFKEDWVCCEVAVIRRRAPSWLIASLGSDDCKMNRWNPRFSKIFLGISGKVRFKAKSWCILPSVSLRYLSRSLSRAFSLASDAFVVSSCSCAADPQRLCLTSAHPGIPSKVASSAVGCAGGVGPWLPCAPSPAPRRGEPGRAGTGRARLPRVGRAETGVPEPLCGPRELVPVAAAP